MLNIHIHTPDGETVLMPAPILQDMVQEFVDIFALALKENPDATHMQWGEHKIPTLEMGKMLVVLDRMCDGETYTTKHLTPIED